MVTPELLALLRCPIDPNREAPLVLEDEVRLLCSRCRVQFRTREGIPSLLPEEAALPDGVKAVGQLPCQARKGARARAE
jgi:uncharacterized protein YbaR (Trm112 family)